MKIGNSHGLSFDFLDHGTLKSIDAYPVRISMKETTLFSRSGANIWIRKRNNSIRYNALLGPESGSCFFAGEDRFIAKGVWEGLEYECTLRLSGFSMSWQWSIEIENKTNDTAELDLIYLQDAGLKQITGGQVNEYYVSQYLERRILEDKDFGSVVCCRQNMKEPVGNPWMIIACKNRAISGCTDGMQFYGRTSRGTGIPEGLLQECLGGEYSGESSVVALQEKPFILSPDQNHESVFLAAYMHDHPQATSEDDLNGLSKLITEFSHEPISANLQEFVHPGKSLFDISGFLPVCDLSDDEIDKYFGKERRHPEKVNGRLLSFFSRNNDHVVLHAKEISVDRPHGHIMQANARLIPDENIMSTTSFAHGVFNSHMTQGNTNFNTFLSVCSSQFNLARENGQRIFVGIDGKYYLLGIPSAFEMGLNHCRWLYRHGDHCFQVRSWTSMKTPRVNIDFRVLSRRKVKLLVTHHFDDANGWKVKPGREAGVYYAEPEAGSMIADKFQRPRFRMVVNTLSPVFRACGNEILFDDNIGRGNSLFVIKIQETSDFSMSFIGEVCNKARVKKIKNADDHWLSDSLDAQKQWNELSLNLNLKGPGEDIAAISEILPWYGMNALTHYLTPYGLEQFSGAAWGTRDIAQGPFDLLLCTGRYDEAKQVLRIIFSNQNQDGGWPQWWMFDSYADIRADGAHGDIAYWCIIALSNYIKATGDIELMEEILPFYQVECYSERDKEPLIRHIDRLVGRITSSFIPGTALVPFDGGDWNDSLQPVNRELAQRMVSSWTVEMNYQAFVDLNVVYEKMGNKDKAADLKNICERIKADFNKYLIRDGIVGGYGIIKENGGTSLLLHPVDDITGVRYSILPMTRGIISEIFSKEQAISHQDIIDKYLKGPDGARLMDRPLKYKGGIQAIFQRAESSTFFGREIGLMYMHEHIRYAESQAILGRADAFMRALRQATPVGYQEIVPCGDIRQSNCYYSSSDVAFRNRYEADILYDEIKTGRIALRGGWRVYSSGPGIYLALIVTRFLGLRIMSGNLIIDPVIPHSLDGLTASMEFMGHPVTFIYKIQEGCFSPGSITVNGKDLKFDYEENKYRKGGALIKAALFSGMMDRKNSIVEIHL